MARPVSPVVVGFEDCEVNVAETQDQYGTLPVIPINDGMGTIISRWELTEEEVLWVIQNRCILLKQSTFGKPIYPVLVLAEDVVLNRSGENNGDSEEGTWPSNGPEPPNSKPC